MTRIPRDQGSSSLSILHALRKALSEDVFPYAYIPGGEFNRKIIYPLDQVLVRIQDHLEDLGRPEPPMDEPMASASASASAVIVEDSPVAPPGPGGDDPASSSASDCTPVKAMDEDVEHGSRLDPDMRAYAANMTEQEMQAFNI